MATSTKQDKDFLESVIATDLLEQSIQWITGNMEPEEVFGENRLTQWAQSMELDSIFTEKELGEWAENNGYVKEV